MSYPSYYEVEKVRRQLAEVSYQHWIHDDLWGFNWWLLLAATIVPWFIWFRLVDRDRIYEIFSYAMGLAVAASALDVIGINLEWFGYPDGLVFLNPPLIPADLTVLPVVFSLIFQQSTSWKKYLLYVIVASALLSFVLEPIFKIMGIYENQHFPHIMSFLGFILLTSTLKGIMHAVSRFKQKGAR